MENLINILDEMKSDTIQNYIIAGLESSLLENGKVRYFENSRDHQDSIAPHSHRYDFTCLVIAGYVKNLVWSKTCMKARGDLFESSVMELDTEGLPGRYIKSPKGRDWWIYSTTKYHAGQCYSMEADEVHSIQFSRGAKVLFFEGPQVSSTSLILEPVVDGNVIETGEVRDWMFLNKEVEEG